MELKVKEIVEAAKGRLISGSPEAVVREVAIDSRKAAAGSLFVPLQGTQADGHIYIGDALKNGAAASFVQAGHEGTAGLLALHPDRVFVEVASPLDALGDTAWCWRKKFSTALVAITGSNGKTTTKEMAWSILKDQMSCIKNPGNFNNLIGLPLSLFALDGSQSAAVFEMGMSEPGEIRRLAEISSPQAGLITNVGPSHLEQLKTLDGVAAAKGELFECLDSSATAIVNCDDSRVVRLAEKTKAKVLTFGVAGGEVRASNIADSNCFGSAFDLHVQGKSMRVELKFPARPFVINALAAAAIASVLGVGPDGIRQGLESFSGVPGRMELVHLGGVRVINDAYNASPVSMQAALQALAAMRIGSRRFAALGDMLELGDRSEQFHQEIGAAAAALSIDYLFLTGDFAPCVQKGAVDAGMQESHIFVCRDLPALSAGLKDMLHDGDALLLKGSRRMKMEKVIELLKEKD